MSDNKKSIADENKATVLDLDIFKQHIASVLNEAKRCGASAAEAAMSADNGMSVTVRLGDVETLEHHCNRDMGITVYKEGRKGSASTTDFSEAALREAVRSACSVADYTSHDVCAGLAEASQMATDIPVLDLEHPWELSVEQAKTLALQCEQAARDFDTRISNSEGATVDTHRGAAVYGNTHGFLEGYAGTRHSISCSVLAGEGDAMQRNYWYSVGRQAEKLEAPHLIGEKAAQRTINRLNARQLSTRQAAIVFTPEMARSLWGHFLAAIQGNAIYRQASFLLNKLDDRLFPAFIRIHEQPHLQRALGSAPFDNEGVATQDRDIVTDGVLQTYLLDSYSARKLNMQTTGHAGGVHNLCVEAGDKTQQALLQEMGTGLLVTEMMGQGVNLVTGDYSRGASGYWVEQGEIQYPVEEITIAGRLQDMFQGIIAVGNDIDYRGNIRTGSVWLDKMTIAGQ